MILNQCNQDKIVNEAVYAMSQQTYAIMETQGQLQRPSSLYRPTLTRDGDRWCALYGENLQDGVAGFGESPFLAMSAFDLAWGEKLTVMIDRKPA